MQRLIAECVLAEFQEQPDYHIRVQLDDPIAPRLTMGMNCEFGAGNGAFVLVFLPLVDLHFGPDYVSVLSMVDMRAAHIVEYCDPGMMNYIYREIHTALQELELSLQQQ